MRQRRGTIFLALGAFVFAGIALTPPAAAAPPAAPGDSPFGFTTSFYPPKRPPMAELEERRRKRQLTFAPADEPPYSTALELGVGWERPSNPVISWNWVQPDRDAIVGGRFDWTLPDSALGRVPPPIRLVVTVQVGLRPLVAGCWQFQAPQARAAFLTFLRAAVERYDGDGVDDMPGLKNPVRFWQIENEPETCIGPSPPGAKAKPNIDWKEFAELLRLGAGAIRAADPGARVLCAGTFTPPAAARDQLWADFWLPLIEELDGQGPDIFDLHWFDPSYRDSFPAYRRLRDALDRNGFRDAEIWITETGASSQPGELHQAVELVKRFVYPLCYGVKRVFWAWGLVEGWPPFTCESPFDYTGLVYDGSCPGDPGYGVRKLAYHAYALMTRKLAGADFSAAVALATGRDDVVAYRIPRRGGEIYVVWRDGDPAAGPRPYSLRGIGDGVYQVTDAVPSAAEGRQVPAFGEGIFATRRAAAAGGALALELGARPVYIERAAAR